METVKENSVRFTTGNQLIAEGAVRAGCRFFAGYPITPASGIYKSMIDLLQKRGDVAISSPDEISALAYCVGASMRGHKSMTATSGPGWALMIETFQYALMTETPLVVAIVQRLGPSTGGATQGGQGDILLTEFCTSGGYTVPVLCPSTPQECYNLTVTAFNWSEMLRTPVILLTDKEVGMTSESVDVAEIKIPPIVERSIVESGSGIRMYDFRQRNDVPPFLTVGGKVKVTHTGSAHNKRGELKKNDEETLEVLYHLEEKIISRHEQLSMTQYDRQQGAGTLIISYGITARTVKEAVRNIRRKGKKVSSLLIHSLFPIPRAALVHAAADVKQILIPEENLSGQYRSVIAALFPGKEIVGINKIGQMITPGEIEHAVI